MQKGELLYSKMLFALNIMSKREVAQTCLRKKIKAAEINRQAKRRKTEIENADG